MKRLTCVGLLACLGLAGLSWTQVRVSNRPAKPLFEGRQGKQNTEIHVDPATGVVTLKLLVQDPNGYFIPNLRPGNFVVYEDGVKQSNISVEIEHAPASLALLLEHGGRYPSMNRELVNNVTMAATELLRAMGDRDRIGVWTYADQVTKIADYQSRSDHLEVQLSELSPPDVSEANLWDALVSMVKIANPSDSDRRHAIVLVSSCVDTFSKAKYEDALGAARRSPVPIYVVSLAKAMSMAAEFHGPPEAKRIDWQAGERELQELAKASGGRLYSPNALTEMSADYDDMMENLKVRYLIRYRSSGRNPEGLRTVRVELIDPASGKPLKITDERGRAVYPVITLREGYTLRAATKEHTQ